MQRLSAAHLLEKLKEHGKFFHHFQKYINFKGIRKVAKIERSITLRGPLYVQEAKGVEGGGKKFFILKMSKGFFSK